MKTVIVFHYRDLIMEFDPLKEIYTVLTKEKILEETENPMRAWNVFSEKMDRMVRERIGDALEAKGLNRWTGEPMDPEKMQMIQELRQNMEAYVPETQPDDIKAVRLDEETRTALNALDELEENNG